MNCDIHIHYFFNSLFIVFCCQLNLFEHFKDCYYSTHTQKLLFTSKTMDAMCDKIDDRQIDWNFPSR